MSRRRRWSGGWAWWGCRGRPVSRWCRWPHSGPQCSSPSHPLFGRFRPRDGTASRHRCRRKLLGAERQRYGAGMRAGALGPGRKEGCPLLTVRGIGTLHTILSADAGDRRKVSRRARCPLACARGAGRQKPPRWVPVARPQPGGHALSGSLSANEQRRWFQHILWTQGPSRPLPPQGLVLGRVLGWCHGPGSLLPASFTSRPPPLGQQRGDSPSRLRTGHPSGPEGRSPCWEAAG